MDRARRVGVAVSVASALLLLLTAGDRAQGPVVRLDRAEVSADLAAAATASGLNGNQGAIAVLTAGRGKPLRPECLVTRIASGPFTPAGIDRSTAVRAYTASVAALRRQGWIPTGRAGMPGSTALTRGGWTVTVMGPGDAIGTDIESSVDFTAIKQAC
ncbi:hypothetical protein [Streptacidiphilus sp. PAMC 29251]